MGSKYQMDRVFYHFCYQYMWKVNQINSMNGIRAEKYNIFYICY